MDVLEILTNLDNVFPYFQPIFSADGHQVIGYEVLGRYKSAKGIVSLGSFFLDENIPEEYRLEVDDTVLRKALEKMLILDEQLLIFINRDADLLMYDNGESFLNLLLKYQTKGIKLDRIVLESSDCIYKGNVEHLDHLLNYYRTYGIKIAIDNKGNEKYQLDRIGQLSPNILKVDLNELRSTASAHVLHDILYSLSLLARKIGATLLFKNIEMVYQLQFAWRNGGRYYQGCYLHPPSEDFVDQGILKEKLKVECHRFISYEKRKLQAVFDLTQEMNEQIQQCLQNKNRKLTNYDEILHIMASIFDDMAFRLYICDEDGFQKSANIIKLHGDEMWQLKPEYFRKNWSWRPYFLENIMKMSKDKKGILSDLYSDIETGEMIRTFSYPLNANDYLFVDIPYRYLYEKEDLL